MRKGDWIQTYTGTVIYPLDPLPEEVRIEDIAHALSNLCRFAGHCKDFYSVAEHSIRVSHVVPREDALWGLLHDASEAYICDLTRPLKRCSELGALYLEIEASLMRVICHRFNLDEKCPASVKAADTDLLMTEKRDLMHGCNKAWENIGTVLKETIIPMVPRQAERAFLSEFRRLTQ